MSEFLIPEEKKEEVVRSVSSTASASPRITRKEVEEIVAREIAKVVANLKPQEPLASAMRDLIIEAKSIFTRLESQCQFAGTRLKPTSRPGTNKRTGDQMRDWLARARVVLYPPGTPGSGEPPAGG